LIAKFSSTRAGIQQIGSFKSAHEIALEEEIRKAIGKVIEQDRDNDKLYFNIASSKYNFGSWNQKVERRSVERRI